MTQPEYPGVYVQEVPSGVRTITGVPTSITAFVGGASAGPTDDPLMLSSFAEFERRFGGLDLSSPMSYAVRDFFVNGGSHALIVRVDADDIVGDPTRKSGLYALNRAEQFNLLCIPPRVRDSSSTPSTYIATSPRVYQAALALCVARRAMLIVDPDPAWGTQTREAVTRVISGVASLGLTGPAARNAALYFPCVRQADPLLDGRVDTFAPSGAIAGIMARTDAQRGVWKAPAGLDATLRGVQGLQMNVSTRDSETLNPLGINGLRAMAATGCVVWGARTMSGADAQADEYKYVPVRRLALFIEESIERGTKWAVFEPNDEPLWAQVRLTISAFMQQLFRQGAFQGSTPREAYFVTCDAQTTTQHDIARGVLNILVGFAPLRPAEFVVLHIRQQAAERSS